MALPTNSEILGLDIVDWSLPLANIDATSTVDSKSLDIIDWSLPLAINSNSGGGGASTTTVWINVSGTWKQATVHINVNGTWKAASNVPVNVNGTWKTS